MPFSKWKHIQRQFIYCQKCKIRFYSRSQGKKSPKRVQCPSSSLRAPAPADNAVGELDGHWHWYWWTWRTQLSSPETQSFKACPPELPWGELPGSKPPPALPPPPSTQPGQDQPLHYHELMLKLWNAILPNTQSITSSLSDMKTSNYKGWQKGFVQQGII